MTQCLGALFDTVCMALLSSHGDWLHGDELFPVPETPQPRLPKGEVIYPRKQSPHSNLSVRSLDYIFLGYQLPEKEVSKLGCFFPSVSKLLPFLLLYSHTRKALGFVWGRKKKQLLCTPICSTHHENFHLTPTLVNLLTRLKKHFGMLTVPTNFDSVISRISESFNSLAV